MRCFGRLRREKDINEVVQTTTVFANVSKGVLAKREDLQAAFGTHEDEAVCRMILADGDMQVVSLCDSATVVMPGPLWSLLL